MRQHKPLPCRATRRRNRTIENLLRLVVCRVRVVLPIERVEVRADHMVAQGVHRTEACGAAVEVRRSHVCGVAADDAEEGTLELVHLGLDAGGVEVVKVRVGPGVGGDLVAAVVHVFHDLLDACVGGNWGTPVCTAEIGHAY